MSSQPFSDTKSRLAARFPGVPQSWVSCVVDNTVDMLGRAGISADLGELEQLVVESLLMRRALG